MKWRRRRAHEIPARTNAQAARPLPHAARFRTPAGPIGPFPRRAVDETGAVSAPAARGPDAKVGRADLLRHAAEANGAEPVQIGALLGRSRRRGVFVALPPATRRPHVPGG